MLAGQPATISEPWWVTNRRWRKTFRKSFKNEPGHRNPLLQNQGGKLCLGSFISLWLWKEPTKFIWFQKFIILSTRLYPFHKTQVIHKTGLSIISKTRSTPRILHYFGLLQFLRFTNQPSPVSSISINSSTRQPSRTQPATSTPEKSWRGLTGVPGLFLCPQTELLLPTGSYRSQLFSDSTNRQRSSLP